MISRSVRSIALALGVCAVAPFPATAVSARPPRTKATAKPPVVVAGHGIPGCTLGMLPEQIGRGLGRRTSDDPEYIDIPSQGIEIGMKGGRIEAIFFYVRAEGHRPFRGVVDRGIGPTSSIDAVKAAYGEPGRVGESVITEFGPNHGAHETYLEYSKLGIGFSFYDGRLAIVRVFAPR